jgi:hypothetical protein
MAEKHPEAARIGGPGSSHQNRQHPEKSKPRGPHPADRMSTHHSGRSGGGEPDAHHLHDPARDRGN